MKLALAVALIGTMLMITACGGGSHSKTSTGLPFLPASDAPGRFKGPDRMDYLNSKVKCGAIPAKRAAHYLGIQSTHPTDLARAYSEQYPLRRRQPTFEGCLAGFRSKRPR